MKLEELGGVQAKWKTSQRVQNITTLAFRNPSCLNRKLLDSSSFRLRLGMCSAVSSPSATGRNIDQFILSVEAFTSVLAPMVLREAAQAGPETQNTATSIRTALATGGAFRLLRVLRQLSTGCNSTSAPDTVSAGRKTNA